MREITKTAYPSEHAQWSEYTQIGETELASLSNTKYDAIISAREFLVGSLTDIISTARASKLNKETPIFLFTSDMSKEGMDSAFDLGVTDVFFKHEIPALADTLSKIAAFPNAVKGAKVLIVEDNNAVCEYYKNVLEEIQCEVISTDDCDKALEILDSQSLELVITDLNLDDGGQGQRIIHKMRHNSSVVLNKIPIMVLSGIETLQLQTGLFFLGIDDYLIKPVPPLQFSLRVVNLIKKFRIFRQAKEQANTLKKLVQYDKLTKAYNRTGFENIARFCVANNKRQKEAVIGILYLDLDNFKPINDTHGHDAGDLVLKRTCEFIMSILREHDILARWGGDEFVILLNQCDLQFIETISQRIERGTKQISQQLFGATCSVGFAYGKPRDYKDVLKLVSQADKDMYHKKSSKKLAR